MKIYKSYDDARKENAPATIGCRLTDKMEQEFVAPVDKFEFPVSDCRLLELKYQEKVPVCHFCGRECHEEMEYDRRTHYPVKVYRMSCHCEEDAEAGSLGEAWLNASPTAVLDPKECEE